MSDRNDCACPLNVLTYWWFVLWIDVNMSFQHAARNVLFEDESVLQKVQLTVKTPQQHKRRPGASCVWMYLDKWDKIWVMKLRIVIFSLSILSRLALVYSATSDAATAQILIKFNTKTLGCIITHGHLRPTEASMMIFLKYLFLYGTSCTWYQQRFYVNKYFWTKTYFIYTVVECNI